MMQKSVTSLFSVVAQRGFRSFCSEPPKRKLIGRYNATPIELYRIQTGVKVNLRDYEEQRKKGRTSFDLVTKNGMVYPAEGEFFIGMPFLHLSVYSQRGGPNGASLRPGGLVLGEIIANFKGAHRIIEIPKGKRMHCPYGSLTANRCSTS